MKNHLSYILILFCFSLFGQTLEKTYTSNHYDKINYAFFINDELNFYTIDRTNNEVKFYDSSHNLFKTIIIELKNNWDFLSIYTITDKLFNSDSKIEFIVRSRDSGIPYTNLTVFNEDGEEIFEFELVDDFKLIKTPENTFKLITTSFYNNNKIDYKVYNLSGTLDASQETLLNKDIIQYPNPTSKNLYLKNIDIKNKGSFLEIFTIDGKKVLTKNIKQSETYIDVSNLSKGVYYYKIGRYSHKFIKN
jgi:hypothetical protein